MDGNHNEKPCLKYLNQCKATPTVPLSDIEEKEEPTDISSISDLPTYDTLLSIINQLPVGYQTVFKLSVLKGLSHKEIGMLLGITPHSSSSQLFRAKVMLRKLITHLHILTIVWICTLSFIIWLNMNKKDKSNNHSISTISNKTEKKNTKNLTKDVFLPQQAHLSHQVKIASRIYSRQKDSKDSTLATIQKADSMTTNNTISNQKNISPLFLSPNMNQLPTKDVGHWLSSIREEAAKPIRRPQQSQEIFRPDKYNQ